MEFDVPILPYVIPIILWVLAGFSAITWAILLYKAVTFIRQRNENGRFLGYFIRVREAGELESLTNDSSGNLNSLAKAMIYELNSVNYALITDLQERNNMMRHALMQERRTIQVGLESGLASLASIGSISTILGLLGTVWSIMNLLKSISSFSSAGLDVVAGPIGDALITTAVGIIVAIPALLGHNFFVRRIRLSLIEMDKFCERLQHLAIRSGYRV
jgi:biopolymer transport protein ExbB